MAEYQLPGQPTVVKEGTYRIHEEPIHSDVWDGLPDRHNKIRQRGRGLFHVSAVIKEDGSEDTTPRVYDLVGRTFENFMTKVRDMHDFGIEYDEREYHVVVSENGDVRIVKD